MTGIGLGKANAVADGRLPRLKAIALVLRDPMRSLYLFEH